MKKHVRGISAVLALSAILATGTAMAAGPWSGALAIATIELDPVGTTGTSTFLSFTTTPSDRPACGLAVSQVFLFGGSDHVKAMTTLATAAFLAGRTVKVYWQGACFTDSFGKQYANVQDLSIQ